mgnify:FL=1
MAANIFAVMGFLLLYFHSMHYSPVVKDVMTNAPVPANVKITRFQINDACATAITVFFL